MEVQTRGSQIIDQTLNKYGWTCLHAACYFGQIQIVRYIVEALSDDINKTNFNGWHSLYFAVIGGHLDIIDYLLFETNVDITLKDVQDQTVLSLAQQQMDQEILSLFQEREETYSTQSSSSSLTFDEE